MDKHSPTPWRLAPGDNPPDFSCTVDARGCFVFGDNSGPKKADAALIVDAVNERARLRELVRRLADTLQSIIDAAEGRGVGRLDEGLVREAREATGESQ